MKTNLPAYRYDLFISEAIKRGRDMSICFACANANGGQWPEHHAATCWVGECGVCGKEVSCCALSDWNWPGRKTKLDREV